MIGGRVRITPGAAPRRVADRPGRRHTAATTGALASIDDSLLRLTVEGDALRIVKLRAAPETGGSPRLAEIYERFTPVHEEAIAANYTEEAINGAIDRAVAGVRSPQAKRHPRYCGAWCTTSATPTGPGGRVVFERAGSYRLVVSPPLLAEYLEVIASPELTRKFRSLPSHMRDLLSRADVVAFDELPAIDRDPQDAHILAAAAAGGEDYFVSADNDRFDPGAYAGITILSAPAFLGLPEREQGELPRPNTPRSRGRPRPR